MNKLSYKQKFELLRIAIAFPLVVAFFAWIMLYPFM